MYEIGKTYEPKAKEHAEWLNNSAKKYNQLYSKYDKIVAGLYARLWEGRIYNELGQADKAIAAFKDLLTLPDDGGAFQKLQLQALAFLVETYTKTKKYPEAIAAVDKWAKDARADDEASEDGVKIHFLAGQVLLAQAKALKEGDAQIAKLRAMAKSHFDHVARFRGEYQHEARQKVAELAGTSVKDVEPTDYLGAQGTRRRRLGKRGPGNEGRRGGQDEARAGEGRRADQPGHGRGREVLPSGGSP